MIAGISKKTKYALKALLALAEEYGSRCPVLISEIAEKENISRKFLELILLELKNKGFLFSKKGKGGGYLLARSPGQISVGSVIRILEGTLSPLPCLSHTAYRRCEECQDENTCAIRLLMKEVREATVAILDSTSLEDMAERARHGSEAMYFI